MAWRRESRKTEAQVLEDHGGVKGTKCGGRG